MLDSERIARETLAHSLLPKAFKRAGADRGPDELHRLLSLWHNRRRSIVTSRQHLVGDGEHLLRAAAPSCVSSCPTARRSAPGWQRCSVAAAAGAFDPPTRLRLATARRLRPADPALDRDEKQVTVALDALVDQSGSMLGELCGLCTRSVAELLVETGNPRRFTEGNDRRFNATAPLPASTAEGFGEPVRHRYNPGGDRRINAVLHRMVVSQLRCEPPPRRSTPTPAPTGIPKRRPAASSSDTSQTSSTDA